MGPLGLQLLELDLVVIIKFATIHMVKTRTMVAKEKEEIAKQGNASNDELELLR